MPATVLALPEVNDAIGRLVDLAKADTGQARYAANFLLAWWNGDDWGHFPIADLFCVDHAVSADMITVLGFLAKQPCAIYPDQFGRRDDIAKLIALWRRDSVD